MTRRQQDSDPVVALHAHVVAVLNTTLDVEAGLAEAMGLAKYDVLRREVAGRLDVDSGLVAALGRLADEPAENGDLSPLYAAMWRLQTVGFDVETARKAAEVRSTTLGVLLGSGVVNRSVRATGTGDPLFSVRDLLNLVIAKRLTDAAVPHAEMRRVIDWLDTLTPEEVHEVTLVVDDGQVLAYSTSAAVLGEFDSITGRYALELAWVMDTFGPGVEHLDWEPAYPHIETRSALHRRVDQSGA